MNGKEKKKKKINSEDETVAWRKVIQKQMYAATIQESKSRYQRIKPHFNYRWEHVRAVVHLAIKLGKLVKADLEVVEAAAWLHDIAKNKGQRHPQEGAKIARKLLPETDFPTDKIEKVAKAIEDHMGLWRDEPLTDLESMVLWDADKLTKIGLTAVVHGIGMGLMAERDNRSELIIRRGQRPDWMEKTVASMHTEPAKKAAVTRLNKYRKFWRGLEREISGKDILL